MCFSSLGSRVCVMFIQIIFLSSRCIFIFHKWIGKNWATVHFHFGRHLESKSCVNPFVIPPCSMLTFNFYSKVERCHWKTDALGRIDKNKPLIYCQFFFSKYRTYSIERLAYSRFVFIFKESPTSVMVKDFLRKLMREHFAQDVVFEKTEKFWWMGFLHVTTRRWLAWIQLLLYISHLLIAKIIVVIPSVLMALIF